MTPRLAPPAATDPAGALAGVPALVVSPVAFAPDWEGNRKRVKQIVEMLRGAGADVHFLFIEHTDGDMVSMAAALGENRVYRVADPRREGFLQPWYVLMRAARLTGWSWLHNFPVDAWNGAELDSAVGELVARHGIRLVVCEYVFYSRFLERLKGITSVIDTHDVFADRWRVLRRLRRAPDWFSTPPSGERRALRRADFVLAIQATDAEHFKGYGHSGVFTVEYMPPARDEAAVPTSLPLPRTDGPLRLCFVGSNNDVNVSAVHHYLDRIHPVLEASGLQFEMWIAGSVCDRFSGSDRALPSPSSRLRWLGRVESIGPVWDACDVLVNAVADGTGLPIKVVEALDAGLHVFGTPAGVRGLPPALKLQSVVTLEHPQAWVPALQRLDDARRRGADLRRPARDDAAKLRRLVEDHVGRFVRAVAERVKKSGEVGAGIANK